MIKNIIFDFGDVFINLDKQIVLREMIKMGGKDLSPLLSEINNQYEIGAISSEEFIDRLRALYPIATPNEIIDIWNSMLLDFPEYRLEFIESLAMENRYRLFLLSNTNALHIPHVETKMGVKRFNRFKNSFEKFYLSHEIGLRKPNRAIFQFVLDDNGLMAEETLFIDDSQENTTAASSLGLHAWNLLVGQEDITELKSKL